MLVTLKPRISATRPVVRSTEGTSAMARRYRRSPRVRRSNRTRKNPRPVANARSDLPLAQPRSLMGDSGARFQVYWAHSCRKYGYPWVSRKISSSAGRSITTPAPVTGPSIARRASSRERAPVVGKSNKRSAYDLARPASPGSVGSPAPTRTNGSCSCTIRCIAMVNARNSSSEMYCSSSISRAMAASRSRAASATATNRPATSFSRSPLSATPASGSKSRDTSRPAYPTRTAEANDFRTPRARRTRALTPALRSRSRSGPRTSGVRWGSSPASSGVSTMTVL